MAAWTETYYQHHPALYFPEGSPHALAAVAIKTRLADLGYGGAGLVTGSPVIGSSADAAIRAFQADAGLFVDGRVGPSTAEALFRPIFEAAEVSYGVQGGVLVQVTQLESSWDPGATNGPYPDGSIDRGLDEINSRQHPDVSDDEAFDPVFSANWTARSLRAAYDHLGDWDAAIASHNLGEAGGATYLKGRNYVALVRGQH